MQILGKECLSSDLILLYHIYDSILLSENMLTYNIYLQDSILEYLAAVPSLLLSFSANSRFFFSAGNDPLCSRKRSASHLPEV